MTTTSPPSAGVRIWAAGTAAYGTVLLVAPHAVAAEVGRPGRIPASWLVRLLGARQVGQGVLLLAKPTGALSVLAAGVDAVHAASMLAAAHIYPPFRRAAWCSGAVAAASALVGGIVGARARR